MSHKIFLSHNHNDKPLVEAVAIKLAGIFGQDKVFYDSWSIRPGDGIIDQMNKGLEAPEFVFFFVSKNSLTSGMVRLEWQNALYSASKGNMRIVPVRVDGSEVPPILKQTLFIDMHTIGLEAAIAQIVSVTQGNASFTPQHQGFSNLSYTRADNADGSVDVVVRASHLMEPNPHFAMVVSNRDGEIEFNVNNGSPSLSGFGVNVFTSSNGGMVNGLFIRPIGGALTPSYPVRIKLTSIGSKKINLIDIFHERGEGDWVAVPRSGPGTISFDMAGSFTTGLGINALRSLS